jgi:hypothetical protein
MNFQDKNPNPQGLKKGEQVVLDGQPSPIMIIDAIDDTTATCSWEDAKGKASYPYLLNSLRRVPPPKAPA